VTIQQKVDFLLPAKSFNAVQSYITYTYSSKTQFIEHFRYRPCIISIFLDEMHVLWAASRIVEKNIQALAKDRHKMIPQEEKGKKRTLELSPSPNPDLSQTKLPKLCVPVVSQCHPLPKQQYHPVLLPPM